MSNAYTFHSFLLSCFLSCLSFGTQAQTTIAAQDFESPSLVGPLWNYNNTGATIYSGSTPATNARPSSTPLYSSSNQSIGRANGTATIEFAPVNTGSFTNVRFEARLASFSVNTAGNGADPADYVRVEVSSNGGATWQQQLEIIGRNNACWGFTGWTGLATTNFGTAATYQPAVGNLVPAAEGYSTLEISNLPAVADLRIRVRLFNNSTNELWLIDDALIEGEPISCTAPVTQASAFTATATSTTADLSWTSGSGLNRLVVARELSAVTALPVDGQSYTADDFGLGSDLGGGQFVVYDGTGSSAPVAGLVPGRVYHFAVYEYNCAGASSVFNTSLAAANSTQIQTRTENILNLSNACIGNNSIGLAWDLPTGDYDGIVIFAREGAVPANPIADETTYIGANADYSVAPAYGARGRLIYKGSATSVNVSGLTQGQDYTFKAYTYRNSTGTVWSTGTQITRTINFNDVASALASGAGTSQMEVSWALPALASCWDEILVVVNDAPGISFSPSGDGSAYSANATYGGNNQVVYQGTSSSVVISGLSTGTTYYYEIFVRQGTTWSTGIEVSGMPAQILRPGDMAIVGFDNNLGSGVDFFAISNLIALEPGTQFILANACYELYADANQRTNRWYACDASGSKNLAAQVFTYTGAAALPAGSIICMSLPTFSSPAFNITINGAATTDIVVGQIPGIAMNVNFSTGDPDAIFLMQGSFSEQLDHYEFSGRILSGIQDGALWYEFSDDLRSIPTGAARRRSRRPADIECFAVQASTSSGNYNASYTGTRTGTQVELLAQIVNFAGNWTIGTNYNCGNDFTVLGGYAANIWTGAVDDNWFNCANWLNLTVPDSTSDVAVGLAPVPTPSNDARINPAAPFAERYNYRAQTRDLTINIRAVELNNAARLDIHGSLLIDDAGVLDMSSSAANRIDLYGDWDNNRNQAAFAEGGSVHLVGSTDQILATSDPAGEEFFQNLVLDKPAGDLANFMGYLGIRETMRFERGIVQNIGSALVLFEPLATALNASDASHVNGAVLKNTDGIAGDYFVYPTGKAGHLGQLGLTVQTGIGEYYQAEYFHNGYGIYNLDPTCLDHVSSLEYWNVEELFTGTGEQVQLSLYWTPYSRVFDPADLRIAHYHPIGANPLQWNCEPVLNTTGTSASGIITSNWINDFSPFTFGTPINDLSLPLELLHFEARALGQSSQLDWLVASEEEGTLYHIERRGEDEDAFYTLHNLQARADGSKSEQAYEYTDKAPLKGWNYYRLRQEEANGSIDYSPIRALYFEEAGKEAQALRIYPNPATEALNIEFEQDFSGSIELLNMLGQVLYRAELTEAKQWQILREQNWPQGQYILRMSNGMQQRIQLR